MILINKIQNTLLNSYTIFQPREGWRNGSASASRAEVSEGCPKYCPCFGVSVPKLENYRNKSLPFLDDLNSFGISNSEE
ncbi:hypothetical protein H8356DRAFT_1343965 [Neocallimastix lanati (nom. inval.)]|nr:hypothetical protein H8356DRAFT_1343965 [Neocallimastix sp. JGI-2020a]